MAKFGSVNPIGGIKSSLLAKIRKEQDSPTDLFEDAAVTEAVEKPKKTPSQAISAEIKSMAFRKKSPNAAQAQMDHGGSRMRARDIKLGSRKRGAY